MGTFNYNRSSNVDETCLERKIIKVGDSIYLKIESVDQLASVIKFLDDSKLEKAMNELRESMSTKEDVVDSIEKSSFYKNYDNYKKVAFNSLSPKDAEVTLMDHEARLHCLEEELVKLEKTVTDIPKTIGEITAKMMEANMGDKDKDLKSFSVNMYWNYDSQGEDED